MRPMVPAATTGQDILNTSVHKVLAGNVSPGNGLTFDANGQPLTYNSDNMTGGIIRIGSQANPHGLANSWTGSNVDTDIRHNLNKVPFGYVVVAKSKVCDVYWGSVAATKTDITLRITDSTVDTTIWFLV